MARARVLVVFIVGLMAGTLLVPAIATVVPHVDEVPRVAVLARGDNPVDALASGPVASATGGIVVLTRTDELVANAATALTDFGPDVVLLAGGEAALSAEVLAAVADLGDWETRRVGGASRYETAANLSRILAEYGIDGLDVSDAVPAAERTIYVQADGAPSDNGQRLLDAAERAGEEMAADEQVWRLVLDMGTYDLGSRQLVLPPRIEVVGAHRDSTVIQAAVASAALDTDAAAVVIPDGATLRDLSVTNLDRSSDTAWVGGISHTGGAMLLDRVDVSVASFVPGVGDARPNVYGVLSGMNPSVTDSVISGAANPPAIGIGFRGDGSLPNLVDTSVAARGAPGSVALDIVVPIGPIQYNGSVVGGRLFGGSSAEGFRLEGPLTLHMRRLDIHVNGGTDGTVGDGAIAYLGDVRRDGVINEVASGVAECAYNYTSEMLAIDC